MAGADPPGGTNRRRAIRPDEADGPRVERAGPIWHIRSLATARQVLRARDATSQAGFTAEQIPRGFLRRHPILISDGELHDAQRRNLARFFAPKVVAERYAGLMESTADALVDRAVQAGGCRLDQLALHYAVAVTGDIIGLTSSPVPAMSRRLVRFFRQPPFDLTRPNLGRSRIQLMRAAGNALGPILRFHLADVRPAIRAHRRHPRNDVIGQLLAEGASDADILVECITYGTAGMVTTREFIAMACWHLLEEPALRRRYLTSPQPERLAILHEIIRLEPVVGHLYRRVRGDFTVTDGGEQHRLRAGDLVDLDIRATNADAAGVGTAPLDLCPGRAMARGVNEAGLSFGDGAHRCPGQPLAMVETDVLLTRLLAHEPVIAAGPRLGWVDLIAGYQLHHFELRFTTRPDVDPPVARDRGALVDPGSRVDPGPIVDRVSLVDRGPDLTRRRRGAPSSQSDRERR